MSNAQPVPEADRTTLDGLEPVFTDVHDSHTVSFESLPSGQTGEPETLTVFDAARLLNRDVKAVLSMIRRGKLCATKDKKTREWLIEAQCVRSHCEEKGTGLVETKEGDSLHAVPMWDIGPEGFRLLVEKLDTAQQQLREANYRIGFLESQVVGYTEKLHLLPDLQSQASRASRAEQESDELRLRLAEVTAELQRMKLSFWSRFSAWLTGQQG